MARPGASYLYNGAKDEPVTDTPMYERDPKAWEAYLATSAAV